MREWLNNIAGPQYASAVMWTVGALVLLVVLLVLIRIVRNITSGTFVAGGRNRKTRLAVMDATAVDSQRRLVLVRRDDVEHLILMGGPTDVVVEQNIVPGVPDHAPRGVPMSDSTPDRKQRAAEPSTISGEPARREPSQSQRVEPVAPIPPAPRALNNPPEDARRPERQEKNEPEMPLPRPERESPSVMRSPAMAMQAAPQAASASTPGATLGSVHFLETAREAPMAAPATVATPTIAEAPTPEIVAAERPALPDQPVRQEANAPIDWASRKEPEAPFDKRPDPMADPSLEEEMKRLLGELSEPSRK